MKPIVHITDFGAAGDGRTSNTPALQRAADACRDAGGGTIVVPRGDFVTGIFRLFSGTTLLVEKGGRLVGSRDREQHRVGNAIGGLLYAFDAHDLVLTGEGVLDGNAAPFFSPDQLHSPARDFDPAVTRQGREHRPYGSDSVEHGPMRPLGRPGNMLVFARCRNVLLEGLTLTGAAYWTTHFADCEEVTVRHLEIRNDPSYPNNDGLHFTTCRRVRVQGCRIAGGDDAIAITGINDPAHEAEIALGFSGTVGASEDLEVTDCQLASRSSAVRIGYGTNPVRGVRLRNLEIVASNRGIGIYARQSEVADVLVENCRIATELFHGNWWGRGEPIQISTVRFPGETKLFQVRNVIIRDVTARGENAVTLFSEDEGGIEAVRLERVRHTVRTGALFADWGGNLDLRPAANRELAIHAGGTAPLWAVGVARLELIDCEWRVEEGSESAFAATPMIAAAPN